MTFCYCSSFKEEVIKAIEDLRQELGNAGISLDDTEVPILSSCLLLRAEWHFEGDTPDIKALFRSGAGDLLGFALTGQAVKERMALAKELPDILS